MSEQFNYIEEAKVTLAPGFHGDMVSLAELRRAMTEFMAASEKLDKIKKALFYRKGEAIGATNSTEAQLSDRALTMFHGFTQDSDPAGLTDEQRYSAEVVIHGIIGKATESGEAVELLFKTIFTFASFDETNLLEEIGDGWWYDAILLDLLGSDFETEQRRNIAKLRKRFPGKFTEHDAKNRDLAGERAILEAGASQQERLDAYQAIANVGNLNGEPGQPGDPEPR